MNETLHAYKDTTIKFFCGLSEKALQTQFIEPLLRLTGYTHVYNMGGAGDRGKDMVAVREEFGRNKLYAIQVKRFKFSGKYSQPTSLIYVLNQLEQIFSEPTIDPITRIQRIPDRCIFITPYQISRETFESGLYKLQKAERRDLTIIDGPILADQVIKYMPSSLANIQRELTYRLAVKQNAKYVRESMAFEVKELLLEQIYVDLALLHGPESIETIAFRRTNAATTKVLTEPEPAVSEFIDYCHELFSAEVEVNADTLPLSNTYKEQFNRSEAKLNDQKEQVIEELRAANEKLTEASQSVDNKQSRVEQEQRLRQKIQKLSNDLKRLRLTAVRIISMSPVFNIIKDHCQSYLECVDRQPLHTLDAKKLTLLMKTGLALGQQIVALKENQFFREHWYYISEDKGGELEQIPSRLNAELLPKLEMPILISGAPGAGKTTLLRRLASELADKANGVLPILVICNELKDPSLRGIYSHALGHLKEQDIHIGQTGLKQQLNSGRYRLLFDGLDEAGDKGAALLLTIAEVSRIHEKAFPIVTARESVTLGGWRSALYLHLAPFNDARIHQFVDKWFTSQPTAKARLLSWLDMNPSMKKIIRTPLIAAVACALVDANAEMPTTELELYERRFELLLGKWDRAKGLPGLSYVELQQRFHFIMEMAFRTHVKQTRVFSLHDALEVADGFCKGMEKATGAELVEDCVRRGVFLRDAHSCITFGHLTYQEFLTARYLAHHNCTEFICKVIDNIWWKVTLKMYATRMFDISRLLTDALKLRIEHRRLALLAGLLQFAPFTGERIAKFYEYRKYTSAGTADTEVFELERQLGSRPPKKALT